MTAWKGAHALRLPTASTPAKLPSLFPWEESSRLAELGVTTASATPGADSVDKITCSRPSAPRGALAGFDSALALAAPRGALAGFEFPARRATLSRWIPNSRAIRRYDQPC